MKKIMIGIVGLVGIMLLNSCDDFLNTYPKDALSPATTWKTEAEAQNFLVGCYNGWLWGEEFFYLDCASDIGFSYHTHEGFRVWGNGTMNSSGSNLTGNASIAYNYNSIRKCDHFLANIEKVTMDEAKKKDMIAQVRLLRAYRYFKLNYWYGGCTIIPQTTSASEAQLPRKTEAEVKQHVFDEIDAALNGGINEKPAAAGYVAKGFGLALKMRSALYYGEYERARQAAADLIGLGQYQLYGDFSKLFSYEGRDSEEIILSVQKLRPSANEWFVTIPNNADGGWSSMVPTQNLVDMYEMDNGLTKEEEGSGYDPAHPYANRDPRMAMTVLVPGIDWPSSEHKGILNTLDLELPDGKNTKNPNHPLSADNASKTGLTWAKYLLPFDQYGGLLDPTETEYIVFRFAEAYLTLAEASNELNGPSAEAWDALDKIRTRVGMPVVDRVKYGTKETLRELIRRERTIELAGEGHRRADIQRWKDASGKMVAETVLNGPLNRVVGTINYNETDPFKRAVITGTELIEERIFAPHNRYLPITQGNLDRNPQLKQNDGY